MEKNQLQIHFEALAWKQIVPGARHKVYQCGNTRLRLVEFTSDFVELDWCFRRHIGYLMEGQLEMTFANGICTYAAGDGLFILGGEEERHRARVLHGTARMILVEEA